MRRRSLVLLALGVLVAGAGLALALRAARHGGTPEEVRATLSVTSLLGSADTAAFARAAAPRRFHFPEDHGPHPGFRNEWWYFTGNLVAAGGRRFGYELTFFRTQLAAHPPARASDWASRDVYMAHLAITDSEAQRFLARDRFARAGAVGLAGAVGVPWRVWLEDWQACSSALIEGRRAGGQEGRTRASAAPGPSVAIPVPAGTPGAGGRPCLPSSTPALPPSAFWPIQLSARDSGMALHLALAQGKPPVLEGDSGLSAKGVGSASYYYSLTRMPTTGWLELAGQRYQVAGDSWMDREWSTSALGPDEVGWDWFALQLSDGRDLMLYRIRRRDGTISPYSAGTLVQRDGRSRSLAAADAQVDVEATWSSPRDGARYPARWRVRVPSAALDLNVRPILADQELNLAVRYWEGAVNVEGSAAGRPVSGRGYVELTGYGANAPAARSTPATH